ncbi:hypothetical protein [Nocardioides donggukensis]|uniref:Secreted protein n=1 Tax=Nocardioides donggukensis TaxID=2774019 RepID=A0A927PZ60_9ACTN|nr:hypothetical protein [Nocardioides donggukensis]MBD8869608.1 hypothetical protein [Nocardioides donggukensis]
MRTKSWLAVPFCVTALAVAGMGPAHAQGQVEKGPEHANSICSFSGLNDHPDDPEEGGRVQSYGQIVRAGGIVPSQTKSGPPSPGFFCNGHRFPLQEGGPEE